MCVSVFRHSTSRMCSRSIAFAIFIADKICSLIEDSNGIANVIVVVVLSLRSAVDCSHVVVGRKLFKLRSQ